MPTPKTKPPKMQVLPTNRAAAKRPLRDLLPPSGAELRDVARPVPAFAFTPHVAPRPLGSGAYSALVVDVHGKEQVERMLRA